MTGCRRWVGGEETEFNYVFVYLFVQVVCLCNEHCVIIPKQIVPA